MNEHANHAKSKPKFDKFELVNLILRWIEISLIDHNPDNNEQTQTKFVKVKVMFTNSF